MQGDFGPASFIEADGWFSLETGPWLTSSGGIGSIGSIGGSGGSGGSGSIGGSGGNSGSVSIGGIGDIGGSGGSEGGEKRRLFNGHVHKDVAPGHGHGNDKDVAVSTAAAAAATGAVKDKGAVTAVTAVNVGRAGGAGGCLGGFVIPTEEEAYTRASAVFAALFKEGGPSEKASWVYQVSGCASNAVRAHAL